MNETFWTCTSAFSVVVMKQCLSQLTQGFNFSLGPERYRFTMKVAWQQLSDMEGKARSYTLTASACTLKQRVDTGKGVWMETQAHT